MKGNVSQPETRDALDPIVAVGLSMQVGEAPGALMTAQENRRAGRRERGIDRRISKKPARV
jgi:hypothetical protein